MIKNIMLHFIKKLKRCNMQYNTAPAMNDAIRGTSKEKPFLGLGLESCRQFLNFLKGRVQSVCLIRFPKRTVTFKPEILKALRNLELLTTFFKTHFF